jgi:transcriptional regulator of met regulon
MAILADVARRHKRRHSSGPHTARHLRRLDASQVTTCRTAPAVRVPAFHAASPEVTWEELLSEHSMERAAASRVKPTSPVSPCSVLSVPLTSFARRPRCVSHHDSSAMTLLCCGFLLAYTSQTLFNADVFGDRMAASLRKQ